MTQGSGSSLQQYVKNITDSETLENRFSTIQDVLVEIQQLGVQGARGRENEVLRVFTSFISFIDRYSKAVDMMAQYNASPSCLIWGCLRVVLRWWWTYVLFPDRISLIQGIAPKLGQSLPYFFRDLLCVVERFGHQLSLFCRYDSMFHGREDFRSALSDTYLDALIFLRRARDALRANSSIAAWMMRAWNSFEEEFAEILRRLGQRLVFLSLLSTFVHRDILHRDLEKQAQFRETTTKTLESILSHPSHQVHQDRLRQDILAWLGPVDYLEGLHRNREKRAPGTCQWIFDHPAFKIWTQDASQRLGWAYGTAGMGKTVLCASVVEHFASAATREAPHPTTVGYFFFDGTDETRNNMLAMFRAVLSQLVNRHPSCTEYLEAALVTARNHNRSHMTWRDKPSTLLQRVLAKTSDTLILVDGLDECKDTGNRLADLLDIIKASPNCRAIFFSRDLPIIRDSLSECPTLCINKGCTGDDIKTYFSSIVKDCSIPKGQNEEKIISQLSAGADGMFLWAHFMSQELMSATCPDDVAEAAAATPPGLQLYYTSFLKKLAAKPPRWLELAQNVFLWVLCSPRPLAWPELQCGLSLHPSEAMAMHAPTLHLGRLPYKSAVLNVCQPFIEYYPDGDYFRLAHISVHEFLTRPVDGGGGDDSGEGLRVSALMGHRKMAAVLVGYLSQPGLQTGSILESTEYPLLSYATSHWCHHFLSCELDTELCSRVTQFLSSDDRRRGWLMQWLLMDRDGFPLAKIFRALREVLSRLRENTSGDAVWYDELQDIVQILIQLDEIRRSSSRDSDANHLMLVVNEAMSTSHRIMIIRDLARTYKLANRLDDGISHFKTGIARIESTADADPADGAWLLNGLGILYDQQGRFHLAVETQQRALALQQASPRSHELDRILTTNELGRLYRHQGKFAASREMHEQALGALRALLPEPDVQELWTLSHLAKCHRATGDARAALAVHSEVLGARTRLLGADHPHTLWDLSDVAKCHAALDDAAAACLLQEDVVQRREAVLGPAHNDTLWAMNDLALMYEQAGRLDDALRLHTRAWEGQVRTLGKKHDTTLWSFNEVQRLRASEGLKGTV